MKIKKILIAGSSQALIKYLSKFGYEIYTTSGNYLNDECAEYIDIRESNPKELLKFAVENNIDLTIGISENAIKSDIATIFSENNQLIFSPSAQSAELILSKSASKKFFYKNKIPTARFAVFEKLQSATDYLKNLNYPIVISTDEIDSKKYCCTTFEIAKYYIENMFKSGETKIVTEEYIYGTEFSFYAITDGYHILPLTSSRIFSFSENGDGGYLTSGVGAYVPYNQLENEDFHKIFNDILVNVSEFLRNNNTPYTGIIGIDAVLNNEGFKLLNFRPYFRDIDIQGILNSLDENLSDLFESCANGSFSDEYDDILINDTVSASCLLKRKSNLQIPENLQHIDSDITFAGDDLILTSKARTLKRAKDILSEDITSFDNKNFKYRSDIFKS